MSLRAEDEDGEREPKSSVYSAGLQGVALEMGSRLIHWIFKHPKW